MPQRLRQRTRGFIWFLVIVAAATGACSKAPPVPTDPAKAPWLLDPGSQIKGLGSQDFRIRGISAFNLGNMGAKAAEALPALEKLAKDDPEPKVRERAQEAVGKIRSASGSTEK
jgi:HEAT repeat protein